MHEFFDNIVEDPFSGITFIEPVHVFIKVGVQMLGRASMMDPPQPVLKLHDLFVKLIQPFTHP